MHILITGSNGFTGQHLAELIRKKSDNHIVVGIDIHDVNYNLNVNIYYRLDQFDELFQFFSSNNDEIKIFHLAGLIGAHPISKLIEANVLWTARYLELACTVKRLVCFINSGSSAEYGNQSADQLYETLIPDPVTNYGFTKNIQTQIALKIAQQNSLPIICTRTFNLIGPKLSKNLVVGKLVHEYNMVLQQKKTIIEIGRTDSLRDFIDVRDAVDIYWKLSETESKNGIVVNVASGKSHSIEKIINLCEIKSCVKPEITRNFTPTTSDLDYQYADISRLTDMVGIHNFTTIESSISDMFDAYELYT